MELYFEVPTSVGLLHIESVLAGHRDVAAAIEDAREAAIAAALDRLYEYALLKIGEHTRQRFSTATVGEYRPGETRVTRVPHLLAVDRYGQVHDDVARLHDHVYLGKIGAGRVTGTQWPVDLNSVRRGTTSMQASYDSALHRSLTASPGVAWSIRTGDEVTSELVEPALAQYVSDFPRVICREDAGDAEHWNVEDIAHPARLSPDRSG